MLWRRRLRGAKINFDKSEGLRLDAWRVESPYQGPSARVYEPFYIPGVRFGPGLPLEPNQSEVRAKVEAQLATWLRRRLFLKGRMEKCAVYIFPLILYYLSVIPQGGGETTLLRTTLERSKHNGP